MGDSLGYAVEFDSIAAIRARYGSGGLTSFAQLDGRSHFSDDTQMTLYTVDGLVEALEWANDGLAADEIACLWLAYLRWLATQDVAVASSAPVPQPRWIDAQEVLRHRRAPGNACLSGLATGGNGNSCTAGQRRLQRLRHCDAFCPPVRTHPPHISREAVYKLSSDAASLTHGHPSARLSAAAFSLLIHNIVAGSDIRTSAIEALSYVNGVPHQSTRAGGAAGSRPAVVVAACPPTGPGRTDHSAR